MADRIISVTQRPNGSWLFEVYYENRPGIGATVKISVPAGVASNRAQARAALLPLALASKKAWIAALELSQEYSKLRLHTPP